VRTPDFTMSSETIRVCDENLGGPSTGEVVEVPLLLSADQVSALEQAAHHRGLTTGEMVRRLLEDFITAPIGKGAPPSCKLAAF
jgi:hypothetical protein